MGGFKFTTQDDEDGYIKDGEFHPFASNPYLRIITENTGETSVQAITEDGVWRTIYTTNTSIPLPGFDGWLFNHGVYDEIYFKPTDASLTYGEKGTIALNGNCIVLSTTFTETSSTRNIYCMNSKISTYGYDTLHVKACGGGTMYVIFPCIGFSNLPNLTSQLSSNGMVGWMNVSSTAFTELTFDVSSYDYIYLYLSNGMKGGGNNVLYISDIWFD